MNEVESKTVETIIANALKEDIGDGDHSTLDCVPENAKGKAQLLVKEAGVLAAHAQDRTIHVNIFAARHFRVKSCSNFQ